MTDDILLRRCGHCGAHCAYPLTWVSIENAPGQHWCDDCLATIKHKGDGADAKRKPKDPTDGLIQ